MDAIANFFLRAKHWQVFLLIFGLYCAGEVPTFFILPIAAPEEALVKAALPFVIVARLGLCAYLAWLWSAGMFLNSIVPPASRFKTAFFHVTIVYPAFYAIAYIALIRSFNPPPQEVIIALKLFSLFCTLHNLYFVSNRLVVAETRNWTASFSQYIGPFWLMWLFPFGVWDIQPRINALYARGNRPETFAPAPAS
jgi:hypothetical protein